MRFKRREQTINMISNDRKGQEQALKGNISMHTQGNQHETTSVGPLDLLRKWYIGSHLFLKPGSFWFAQLMKPKVEVDPATVDKGDLAV